MSIKPWFGIVLTALGTSCAAPQQAATPSTLDPGTLKKEIEALRGTVERLDNRLSHLESETAENELTTMTIDSVRWVDPKKEHFGFDASGKPHTLLCHIDEWRGFGKMLRFTRLADRQFVLEAEGQPPVAATAAIGGISSADGSVRDVILTLSSPLAPHASYRLRPLNQDATYRWSVANELVVKSPDA
jgi:hypothetical protein